MEKGAAFETFIAPATGRNSVIRLIAGVLLVFGVYIAFFFVMFTLAWLIDLQAGIEWLGRALTLGATPAEMSALFATFLGMILGVFLAVRLIHRRSPRTLFGPDIRAFLKHFTIALVVGMVIFGLYELVSLAWIDPVPRLSLATWLRWLPLGMLMLLIQVTAEELTFRGYLVQQLASRYASPLIWMLLPAFLFGLAHYRQQEMGANTWLLVGAAVVIGLALTDLTRATGDLGAAIGLHFVSNFWAIMVISAERRLSGFSLFMTPLPPSDTGLMRGMILMDVVVFLYAWLVLRRLLARRAQNTTG